ncbi:MULTISPECIES: 5-formyltetrahydrofolate cyclo-ligase [Neobacillus]|uniref:5-formyltetrahydrofolate cyclo-ligase n=1 Tax=Neobacillus rhizophilus TaxID=2833579 RepID=A0A942YY08_9BACI|nr:MULTISPECIES: 5-formyltetrahydrofolate cyclo-ligase [Neobacillus]MBS4215655.1 5-formyltetrahydrofolate cyclo-ligase [Neobacillus rhizophilus]MBU8916448.1 5-formyltetrahydrofolate cyclo-ligase [Bacillus sp. FJAT-29953]
MHDKNSIRQQMKESLSKLTKPIYEDYSYKIACRLFELEDWEQAQVIGITISRTPEVDTYQIIRKAWESGKQVVVPKCYPKEKRLSFRSLTEFSQLESVFYGLLEPNVEQTTEVSPDKIDLLIVPGLAYTRSGFRLGFGGGYYDRFLTGYSGNTLSLAFEEQLIPEFPVEQYDIPVAKIVTTNEVIKTV